MWADEGVFYQIYPLGFCKAPFENDGQCVNRIQKVKDWIPHLQKLGITAVYFSPVFSSDTHGYNTRDFRRIDERLGSRGDFKEVADALHTAGIRVVLDGVFNHVGRGFWAFKDVQENRWNSAYKDWFYLNFDGDSVYHDGFWYESWEGHYDLVKLNLRNEAVIDHIFGSIREWVDVFDIDGLRLDVAYCLDREFLRRLRAFVRDLKEDFWLVGELLHGDYNLFVNDEMLHSATNYECYKGLYSSFNSMNLFEICHSLNRQFGPEPWTLYKGKHLLCFADNHDVSRIASILANEQHLPLIYALLFGMPGIPCIYYGSEWGARGDKKDGDPALRLFYEKPQWEELTGWIAKLARIHREQPALCRGDYHTAVLTNRQCVFVRSLEGKHIYVCINADEEPCDVSLDMGCGCCIDLLRGESVEWKGILKLPPYSAGYFLVG